MSLPLQVILCVLVADFITGLVHWFEDAYGTVSDSWLSRHVFEPNIRHHREPLAFLTESGVWGRNYIQWCAALVTLAAAWPLGLLCWQLALVAALASSANEVHAWAHRKSNGPLVTLLQEMCLVQTRRHHARHHARPYDQNYCILTCWLNPLLTRLYFWSLLEYALSPVLTVQRGTPARDGY